MLYEPLSREEVISVIEGHSIASRIPLMVHLWTHPKAFGEQEQAVLDILDRYPMDVQAIDFNMPRVFDAPLDDPEYRWVNFDDPYADKVVGHDAKIAISDWAQLDGILENFPDPCYSGLLKKYVEHDGRYRLGIWWFWLFERHWSLRGMMNALMDYYIDPESVHRLFRALTDFYIKAIERARQELQVDGIFTSDDLGTQTGPFFSPDVFNEFFKPYYKEIFDKAHSLGMHFWLHSCGNIEKFIPELIDIGLDVLHPIQKYTMDEEHIARLFGKDLCIWAGMDVQQTIPWGTPEDVRREVRFLIDTYYRPEGRLMITAGNGINEDCPLASLEAFCDEACAYGTAKVQNKA